ncbi:metal ABC transporter substrate-binding protein [soil metagenome]
MLSRRSLLQLASLFPLAAALPAIAGEAPPLKAVASFSILCDMVREIGGGHVDVTTLVGPNGDAHVYEPTPADARAGADILFLNGLDFEAWLPRLVKTAGFTGREVVVSQGVSPRHFENGSTDPHAWQNLANGMVYAANIAEGLAKADPAHAGAYEQNAAGYRGKLKSLDEQVRSAFARIPESRRKIVTSHDAFGYFGAAYGVAFIAPNGLSTEAEASAADVARIIDQIRAEKITAVFVENITNTKLTDQIARETGAKIGGELYSDALSPPDGDAPTYVRMFEWNLRQLTQALGVS